MLLRTIGLYARYLIAKVSLNGKVKFNGFTILYAFPDSSIKFDSAGGIVINSHPLSNLVGLYQRSIIIARYGGKISIGHHCGISGCTIYSMEQIDIGNHVLIGGNCKLIDNDFHPLLAEDRLCQSPENIKKGPIKIGDDCFIGANSIILKGTIIGNNCVIGAGSVVHGSFPDNVIIAGNPAKIIKVISTV